MYYFSNAVGQMLFMTRFFLRGVMKEFLADPRCGNLCSLRGLATFFDTDQQKVTDDQKASVKLLFEKVRTGVFDEEFNAWGNLNKTPPGPLNAESVKTYIESALGCLIRKSQISFLYILSVRMFFEQTYTMLVKHNPSCCQARQICP